MENAKREHEKTIIRERVWRRRSPIEAKAHAEALAEALSASGLKAKAWVGGLHVRVYVGSEFMIVWRDGSVATARTTIGPRGTYLPSGYKFTNGFDAYIAGLSARCERHTQESVREIEAEYRKAGLNG